MKKSTINIAAAQIFNAAKGTAKAKIDAKLEEMFKKSEGTDKELFLKEVNLRLGLLKGMKAKAETANPAAALDSKLDSAEFQPLRVRKARAGHDGKITGLLPGQEYIVMVTAGKTSVVENPPANIGEDGEYSRRKTVAVTSLYTPAPPKPIISKPKAKKPAKKKMDEAPPIIDELVVKESPKKAKKKEASTDVNAD